MWMPLSAIAGNACAGSGTCVELSRWGGRSNRNGNPACVEQRSLNGNVGPDTIARLLFGLVSGGLWRVGVNIAALAWGGNLVALEAAGRFGGGGRQQMNAVARFIIAPALALGVVAGGMTLDASAAAKGDDVAFSCEFGIAEGPAVVITGGEVSNSTNIDISANAGTAISDATGGNNNVGTTNGGFDIASVGNGGGANSAANGGAVSLGDINSGSNAGNAIVVGNTANCAPAPEPEKPVYEKPKGDVYVAPDAPAAPVYAAAPVVALPSTGVGGIDAGMIASIAAAGAAAAAGLGLRRR